MGYDVVLHVIPDVARVLVLAAPYRRVPLDAVGELFSIRRIFKPTKRPNHRGEVEHLDVLVLLEERRHLDVGEILGGDDGVLTAGRGLAHRLGALVAAALVHQAHRHGGVLHARRHQVILEEAVLPEIDVRSSLLDGLLPDPRLHLENVVHRAQVGQRGVRARDCSLVRSPPPVKAAVELGHDQDPAELLRNLKRAPDL